VPSRCQLIISFHAANGSTTNGRPRSG